MASAQNRENVFPTRQTEQIYKSKLKGAKNGYDLLKKKRDALRKEHHAMAAAIYKAKQGLQQASSNSFFAIDDAVWSAGEFKRKMLTGTYTTPSAQVSVRHDNVAGVALPRFRLIKGQLEGRADLGLAGGGREIHRAQQSWSALLTLLVRLAGLQTQFTALDEAIRLTSRRVNALENVLIPRFAGTIKYVQSELDEMEREDIYRIKKVLEVKKKKLATEATARAKFLQQAQGSKAGAEVDGVDAPAAATSGAAAEGGGEGAYAGILHDDEDSDDEANLFG